MAVWKQRERPFPQRRGLVFRNNHSARVKDDPKIQLRELYGHIVFIVRCGNTNDMRATILPSGPEEG